MKAKKNRTLWCIFMIVCMSTTHLFAGEKEHDFPDVLEVLPPHHIEIMLKDDQLPKGIEGYVDRFVIENIYKWNPGRTLGICFIGGDPTLHKRIATAASEWTRYGNLMFDFGYSEDLGDYRICSENDRSEIRISFNYGGYWSVIGTQSMNLYPGVATMNFFGFDINPPDDPYFTSVVLHEFGHAIGFKHEHQSPVGNCDDEFDWDTVYSELAALPNYWSQDKVDHNMRQLPNSRAYDVSYPDRKSIMHYSFPPWMFTNGDDSPCCIRRNYTLSDYDKIGMASAYPQREDRKVDMQIRSMIKTLDNPDLPSEPRMFIQKKLNVLIQKEK